MRSNRGPRDLNGLKETPLIATEIRVSAVHVFDLGSQLRLRRGALPLGFNWEFAEKRDMQVLTAKMFSPERSARLEILLKCGEIVLQRLQLSNGREFHGIPVNIFLSVYSAGLAVALLQFDLSGEFRIDELMELAAMTRGTYEKVIPTGHNTAVFTLEASPDVLDSFQALFTSIAHSLRSFSPRAGTGHWDYTFTCPLIYVKEIQGQIVTKSELVAEFPYQLAGLANMWINHWQWVRREDVEKTLIEESHPLEYGFTIISPQCTFEIHPLLVTDAAKADARTLEYHHFVEWYNLAKLLEMVSLQFYAMRKFDHELSQLSMRAARSGIQFALDPFLLLIEGLRLARARAQILPAIEDFWNIRLARRRYIVEVFERSKEVFLVNRTYTAIQEKLAAIESTINTVFNMSTTVFVLLLTVVATVFGILEVVLSLPR